LLLGEYREYIFGAAEVDKVIITCHQRVGRHAPKDARTVPACARPGHWARVAVRTTPARPYHKYGVCANMQP